MKTHVGEVEGGGVCCGSAIMSYHCHHYYYAFLHTNFKRML